MNNWRYLFFAHLHVASFFLVKVEKRLSHQKEKVETRLDALRINYLVREGEITSSKMELLLPVRGKGDYA